MDHARQKPPGLPVQRLDRDHAGKRQAAQGRLDLFARRREGPGSGADRGRQHDVRRHAVPEHRLCARPDQAGRAVKWKFEPKPAAAAQGVACCDVVNRGAAYADGKIFFNTLDDHTVALDADTGKEFWRTKLGDIKRGETMTMAPLVVKGKVLVGNSGGELGVRGWLTALDANTGKIAWRAYSTGPDKDVLIGRQVQAVLRPGPGQGSRRQDLAARGMEDRRRHRVGLDLLRPGAEPDLLRHRQSRPVEPRPAAGRQQVDRRHLRPRPGHRRGALVLPVVARTTCTTTTASTRTSLVDLNIGGQQRKVLLHPDRNGYIYVLDRTTGEVLSAKPFVHITSSPGVDLKTGRLHYDAGQAGPRPASVVRDICPAPPGAKDWQPSAFSPRTALLYIPHKNLCQDAEHIQVSYIAGTPYVGAERRRCTPGRAATAASSSAWDPRRRARLWSIKEEFPVWSGAAGDRGRRGLLRHDGRLVQGRRCARPATLLWQFKTGSGIIGQPIDLTAARTASSTSRSCPASAAGPARSCRPISTRATAPPRSASSTR